ncbi:MAG: hypothetical protein SP1CHLAM54_04930 [Chlamydiia bacterium]|nr:hypothetical protein [Chlamydiia bacterium]MCH9615405.1 hypothetical protein [Chlamydiia bacterium]MCH9628273.1 hypothetical protein [Chlamydiia bacterium]
MKYLLLTLLFLALQGFFSMLEMACVSFNRVRLQYYVSQGRAHAIWLSKLLNRPTFLFGTTLIGVNTAMQFGSECARRFYQDLGLNPDLALLSQILIVLIFAELSPMFAARHYPEHTVRLGIPVIYLLSKILTPIIYLLDFICRAAGRLFGVKKTSAMSLSRDELQKAVEGDDEPDAVLTSIFTLKTLTAGELMTPIEEVFTLPSSSRISDLREKCAEKYQPEIPIYQGEQKNITGIVYPRDLLRYSSHTVIGPYARSPWFITEKSSIFQILKEFRRNSENLAIVLNKVGISVGILTLDDIISDIFGDKGRHLKTAHATLLDRTFSGDTPVDEINKTYHIALPPGGTLLELVEKHLDHSAETGDSIRIDCFELHVDEITLLKDATISLKTI